MSLLDVLNGMRNGPGGQPRSGSSGGMSPITMAILALLAYKGIKHFGNAANNNSPTPAPTGNGELGDLLKGGLGGLLAGRAAGSILSGGLGSLLNQFTQNGHGEVAKSWVSTGSNSDISESDLAKSIGSEDIVTLAQNTGLSQGELLAGLRRELPGAIDQLTPDGEIPDGNSIFRRA
jgi:uncharacterized protein YidB (DUF937 family)